MHRAVVLDQSRMELQSVLSRVSPTLRVFLGQFIISWMQDVPYAERKQLSYFGAIRRRTPSDPRGQQYFPWSVLEGIVEETKFHYNPEDGGGGRRETLVPALGEIGRGRGERVETWPGDRECWVFSDEPQTLA